MRISSALNIHIQGGFDVNPLKKWNRLGTFISSCHYVKNPLKMNGNGSQISVLWLEIFKILILSTFAILYIVYFLIFLLDASYLFLIFVINLVLWTFWEHVYFILFNFRKMSLLTFLVYYIVFCLLKTKFRFEASLLGDVHK